MRRGEWWRGGSLAGEEGADAAGNVIEAPGEVGKKAIKGVGKGLDKIF